MINLYYDKIKNSNGSNGEIDPPVRSDISITEHFDWCDIEYTTSEVKEEIINNNGLNLYVIELFYVQRLEEVFNNIPQETFNFIKSNDVKILFYFPFEGFKLNLYDNWFKKLHQCFLDFQITDVKKYFIYNNLTIESQYNTLLDNNEVSPTNKLNKVFGFPFFHLEHYQTLTERWKNLELKNSETINHINIFEKDKDFLTLNAKMRAHRLLIVSELDRRDLISKGYVSFLGENVWNFYENTVEHSYNSLESAFTADAESKNYVGIDVKDHLKQYSKNWKSLTLDCNPDSLDILKITPQYYERSYFSITTETGMDHYLRITEKTFKPIVNYHPFLLIGCHGTLEYLRSIGYETFPEMFDESYDQETYIPKRLLMVVDEVEKFSKLEKTEKDRRFKLVYDKLLHNADLFFNVLPEKNKNTFSQIFKDIKNDN
jgi:hypothetical protein